MSWGFHYQAFERRTFLHVGLLGSCPKKLSGTFTDHALAFLLLGGIDLAVPEFQKVS